MSRAQHTRYLTVAIRAARQAGALLRRWAGRPRRIGTKRSAIDLVTDIDRASERLLHTALHRAFPAHGFYGEERTRTNPNAAYRWVVDPIDGTTNFVHGVPAFAISIGLQCGPRVVAGLVYDPMREELFTAVRGAGARLNGWRIRVSAIRRLSDGLLSTGFSSNFRNNPTPYLRWFTALQRRCHAVRRMGCTSLSLAYVACGRQDGFYERDLWPWDIAAGLLLVEEAGGRLTDFRGRPVQLERGEVVASNGPLHRSILSALSTAPRRASPH